MIAIAATTNPGAEADLFRVAADGLVPLQDACVKARAAVEDPAGRRARQHRLRAFHSWTDADGMIAGRYRLTPEVGGAVTKVIDAQEQRIFRSHKAGTHHEPLPAYAADAVADFVLAHDAPLTADTVHRPKGADIQLNIMVDHGVMIRGGTADGEVCEIPGVGPVDVNWVKELLGTAFVTAIIKNGKDILTVAHLGRHVPAEVRPHSSAAAHATSKIATTAATSNATTSTTTQKADPPRSRTSAGSATATTDSKPVAGPSGRETPKPANAHSDHHPNAPHEERAEPRSSGATSRRRRATGPWRPRARRRGPRTTSPRRRRRTRRGARS